MTQLTRADIIALRDSVTDPIGAGGHVIRDLATTALTYYNLLEQANKECDSAEHRAIELEVANKQHYDRAKQMYTELRTAEARISRLERVAQEAEMVIRSAGDFSYMGLRDALAALSEPHDGEGCGECDLVCVGDRHGPDCECQLRRAPTSPPAEPTR